MGEAQIGIVDKRGYDHTFWVRDEKEGDHGIINEVYVGDCYRLVELYSLYGLRPTNIIDVGAHIGAFAVAAKSFFKDAMILCIEPLKRSHELLSKNIEHLQDVYAFHAAVRYDQANIFVDDITRATGGGFMVDGSRASFLNNTNGWGSYEPVQDNTHLVTLEDITTQYDMDWIDILKLDCEGSEIGILENMTQKLRDHVGWIIGEYHTDVRSFIKLAKERFPNHLVSIRETGNRIGMFWIRPMGGT